MNTGSLTERQGDILKALIKEYVNSAEPIGSEILCDKYKFDFSPATMRNEMVELTKLGYLQKDHISAGRFPTPQAFRFFIKNLMDERELPVVNEVAIKQRLWDNRHNMDYFLREATHALSEELQNLVMLITDDHEVYYAGAAHILRHPEFYDIDLTRNVLHLLDQYDLIQAMFSQLSPDVDFGVMLGDEIGLQTLNQCGMVISRIKLPNNLNGYLAVFGPYRLDYPSVIPAVRYLHKVIDDITRNW